MSRQIPASRGKNFLRKMGKEAAKPSQGALSRTLNDQLSRFDAVPEDAFSVLLQMILGEVALKHSIQKNIFPKDTSLCLDSALLASQSRSRGRGINPPEQDGPPTNTDAAAAPPESEESPAGASPSSTEEPPKEPSSDNKRKKKKSTKNSKKKRSSAQERKKQWRLYSDPTATTSWCKAKDCFVYGHRLSAIVIRVNRRDLPVHLSISTAVRPEIDMGMRDIAAFQNYLKREALPLTPRHLIADKGYDGLPFHRFCISRKLLPVVPIRVSQKKGIPPGFTMNEDDVPVCPAGKKMRRHVHNKGQEKITYNCPIKRPTSKNGKRGWKCHREQCPMEKLCEETTVMGPCIHIKTNEESNERLHPKIERESEEFAALYRDRTSVERYFSRVQGMEHRPYRREHLFGFMALSVAIKAHIQVWLLPPP